MFKHGKPVTERLGFHINNNISRKPRSLPACRSGRFAGFLILLLVIGHWSLVICAWAAPQKFPPVSGEIYGQVSTGVKSITVNNRPVVIGPNQNFQATVNLKAGERYLVLNINYEGFRLIKKYLIIRKPETKTFKVFVPKEKIEPAAKLNLPEEQVAPVEKKKAAVLTVKEKRSAAKVAENRKKTQVWKLVRVKGKLVKKRVIGEKPVGVKPAQAKIAAIKRPAAKRTMTYEYLYVWEFTEGRLLAVKKTDGKYYAEVYIPVSKQWLNLKGISKHELEEMISHPLPSAVMKEKTK